MLMPTKAKERAPRKHVVAVRLTREGLEALDTMRGDLERGKFIRQVIAEKWDDYVEEQ